MRNHETVKVLESMIDHDRFDQQVMNNWAIDRRQGLSPAASARADMRANNQDQE